MDVAAGRLPPAPGSPLIGRDVELAELAGALRNAGARVVTVVGGGGCGKTRLALETAQSVAGEFGEGAAFVDLTPVRDPRRVAAEIAGSLGFADAPWAEPLDALVAGLAMQHLLLVLDNFEQLVDAAPTVSEIAARCPRVVVLVTSRRRLNLRGERVLELGPLAMPDDPDPAGGDDAGDAGLASLASVALFCERARAVDSRFDPAGSLTAIGRICRRLDGLPLAIELAAAHTRLLPPAALLERLGEPGARGVLAVLGRGALDGAPHHRTMRDAIQWSYELLGEPARLLLRRLAVFSGGWSLDAVEAVCAGDELSPPDVLDALVDLVDFHLVDPVGVDPSGDPGDGEPRFRMLDMVHAFAAEQLAGSGELAAFAGRHAGYYAGLAVRAQRGLESREGNRWIAALTLELANLRRALDHLATGGRHADGLAATAALGQYWLVHGPVREGQEWLDRFLAAGEGPPEVLADAEGWAIRLAVEAADARLDDPSLPPRLAAAMAVVEAAGDEWGWLRVADHLGVVHRLRGEFDQMDRLHEEVLPRAMADGMDWWLCELLQRRGAILERVDRAAAVETVAAAIAVADDAGHDRIRLRAMLLHTILGGADLAAARTESQRLYDVARGSGDWRGAAMSAATTAALALLAGDPAKGAHWFRTCISLGLTAGYPHAVVWGMMGILSLAVQSDQPAEAARIDGALGPHLATVRTVTPEVFLARYDADVAVAEAALGSHDFARQRSAGESRPWSLAVDDARRWAGEFAGESPPAVPARRRRGPRANAGLTVREREVLDELVLGLSNQQIADRLAMSPKTVMHHTGAVYRKLGVRGRAEAVAHAVRHGLAS